MSEIDKYGHYVNDEGVEINVNTDKNGKEHYYITAPIIVEAIDELNDNNKIYDYIYNNVVKSCVEAIKKGDYEFAYNKYKNSVLTFEEEFARPKLTGKFVKVLKRIG